MSRINSLCLSILLGVTIPSLLLNLSRGPSSARGQDDAAASDEHKERGMQVQYLEIVTNEVVATCAALAAIHGVTFSEPDAPLGNARTVTLPDGRMIGVRAPMHEQEEPVVRPYWLVDDINAAVKQAETMGAQFAMMPTESPGRGTFAIYFQGGNQHGLWQKE